MSAYGREVAVLNEALTAAATAGATTVVTAAGNDLWQQVRSAVARLFGRGDAGAEAVTAQRLEQTRHELDTAGDQFDRVRSAAILRWTTRFEDLLEEHPPLADDLRVIIEQLTAPATHPTETIRQSVLGSDQARQAVQGHGVQVNIFDGGHAPA